MTSQLCGRTTVTNVQKTNVYQAAPKRQKILHSLHFNRVWFAIFLIVNFTPSFLTRCMECRRGLAMIILSVRLSVCLHVCQTRFIVTKRKKRSVQIFIPYESYLASFSENNGWWGANPSLWNFGSTGIGAKSPILNRYSLVAPQPQHLAKKVKLTLIRSPLRAFQWD